MAANVLSAPHFQNETDAFAYVEARLWPDGPVCPHCGVIRKAGRLRGKTTRPGLYKCYGCRKPFTVRMGTVFESSHVPLRIWLQAIYLMCSSKKGISTRQLQRTFSGSMKTAWFLGHRIREAMTTLGVDENGPLGGRNKVVEADETYVDGKAANRKNHVPPKSIVLSLVERDGYVRSIRVRNVSAVALGQVPEVGGDGAGLVIGGGVGEGLLQTQEHHPEAALLRTSDAARLAFAKLAFVLGRTHVHDPWTDMAVSGRCREFGHCLRLDALGVRTEVEAPAQYRSLQVGDGPAQNGAAIKNKAVGGV